MGKNTFPLAPRHALGMLGLLLMLVVAKLVPAAYDRPETMMERVRGVLARRGIDAIAAVGWAIDRLPSRERAVVSSPSRGVVRPQERLSTASGAHRV